LSDPAEFVVTNLTTGNSLSAGDYSITNLTANGLSLNFAPAVAVDGDWRVTLPVGAFDNAASHPSVTPYGFDFFILQGDYNRNRTVDAADFTIWRDTLGSDSDLRANGDHTGTSAGVIDQADYLAWRSNFGNSLDGPFGGGNTRLENPIALDRQRLRVGGQEHGRQLDQTSLVRPLDVEKSEEVRKSTRGAFDRVFAEWS
jgi:hypothetical protein